MGEQTWLQKVTNLNDGALLAARRMRRAWIEEDATLFRKNREEYFRFSTEYEHAWLELPHRTFAIIEDIAEPDMARRVIAECMSGLKDSLNEQPTCEGTHGDILAEAEALAISVLCGSADTKEGADPILDSVDKLIARHEEARRELARVPRVWRRIRQEASNGSTHTVPESPAAGHSECAPEESEGLPVLGEQDQVFMKLFLSRGSHQALLGPDACDEYCRVTGKGIDEGDFRSRVVPVLKRWGLKNRSRKGYYFPDQSPARRMCRG